MSNTTIKRDLMVGSLMTARDMSPYRTGNLRHNAIRSESKSYGFDIVIDFTQAPYAYYLNKEGGAHEGFIEAIEEAIYANATNYISGGSDYNRVYRSAAKRARATEGSNLISRDKERLKSINRARELFNE